MAHRKLPALLIVALSWAAAMPARAAGSSASSATSGASTSIGASSTSIETSSNSSSKATGVAAGDYMVIEVAVAGGAGDSTRLTLQAVDGADDVNLRTQFVLVLPTGVAAQAGLAAGSIVTARPRPYGTEFAAGLQRQAFFLVLADEWYRELNSTAVVL